MDDLNFMDLDFQHQVKDEENEEFQDENSKFNIQKIKRN